MITEIVTFKLPAGTTRENVLATFDKTSTAWHNNPDLVRKYYLFDAERGLAGGVYLWRERAHAEKWHGEEFRQRVRSLYGGEPQSQFFETPVIVDNESGQILR